MTSLRIIGIVLTGILTENYVLMKFLGVCPAIGMSKKAGTALGMSAAVTFVTVLATVVTYPIFALLSAYDVEFLRTLVFVLVIAGMVQIAEIVMKKYASKMYRFIGVYLPMITTNCVVLGVTIIVTDQYSGEASGVGFGGGYLAAIFTAVGAGIGFLVAMLLFAGVRERLEDSDIPKSLRGLPIILVSAAIVAMSFFGFAGLIEGLGLA